MITSICASVKVLKDPAYILTIYPEHGLYSQHHRSTEVAAHPPPVLFSFCKDTPKLPLWILIVFNCIYAHYLRLFFRCHSVTYHIYYNQPIMFLQ